MKNNERYRLLAEIDNLRDKLHKLVFSDKRRLNNEQVLRTSMDMDKLIFEYMSNY